MFVFFLNSIVYCRGARSVYSLQAPENLATPLPVRRMFYQSADFEQYHTVSTHEVDEENCFT
jgi:hypothetical protein